MAKATPKLTIPSPSMMHYRGGRAAIDALVYPDLEEFWRDLELYENLASREPRRQPGRTTRAIASGPFVDRTALLLDPSLMEQARRAAAKFQLELNAAAERVLRKVFSRRRTN